jgi:hypothetical protein
MINFLYWYLLIMCGISILLSSWIALIGNKLDKLDGCLRISLLNLPVILYVLYK